MALSFVEQQLHDIHVQSSALRDLDPVKRRCPRGRLPDPQRTRLADWNQLGDGGVAIQDGDGLTCTHGPQVLAQPRLEVRDAYLLHASIMTRSSHVDKVRLLVASGSRRGVGASCGLTRSTTTASHDSLAYPMDGTGKVCFEAIDTSASSQSNPAWTCGSASLTPVRGL